MTRSSSPLAAHWALDPAVTFLNHGSFGACPSAVLQKQNALRARMEAEPVKYFVRDLEGLLDKTRAALAAFLGCADRDLVFVPNATAGVNAVLRSLKFKPGDELLTTNHAYNACKNALHFAADSNGAKVVVAEVPFPVQNAAEITAAILTMATPRTKIVLLDHVTSPTALIFPVQQIVQKLAARGIDTLIDGAHAPGMVPLNIEAIGAAYYTGNCHKWLCAPKGAGFLHVRGDKQAAIRPTAISHGANSMRTDRSRYLLEFDWTGTVDYSPYLCIGDALEFMASLLPGGWPAVMARNHELACDAREILCRELKVAPPCPPELLGSMATVSLPGDIAGAPTPLGTDPLQDALFFKHGIEVPIMRWKDSRLVRVSCQLYNERAHYEKLAAALVALLR